MTGNCDCETMVVLPTLVYCKCIIVDDGGRFVTIISHTVMLMLHVDKWGSLGAPSTVTAGVDMSMEEMSVAVGSFGWTMSTAVGMKDV